jgi:hypothetical protein
MNRRERWDRREPEVFQIILAVEADDLVLEVVVEPGVVEPGVVRLMTRISARRPFPA